MKIPPHAVKKIAVFRALQLGDLLCFIPALRALHHAYPGARITLLGLPWAQALVERFPDYIDSFIHFPGYPGLPEQTTDPLAFTEFLREVQQQRFDLVLQVQGNGSIVNPMIELFAAKYLAGFCRENDYCPTKDLFLFYPDGIHEIERHLRLVEILGIEPKGTHLEFPLYKKDFEEYNNLPFFLEPKKYVCVHPGSRNKQRQWPPAHFAALANYCAEKGLAIVITGSENEMDIIESVTRNLHQAPIIAAGKTSIATVAILIKNALMLISNCTGVSHIAAAMETPSIVISMDGEPERWAPLNKKLHSTIDWTKEPEHERVMAVLHERLSHLQRDQALHPTIPTTSDHFGNSL